MDVELQEDLADVLEGIDPMDLLLQDPILAEVAEEISDYLYTNGTQPVGFVEEPSDGSLDSLQPSPELSPESSDNSNSSFELVGFSKKSTSVNSKQKASCEVCDRIAGGHLNYGAVTCNSCRAFFSRSSKDNAYENFVCVNVDRKYNNLCKIDSASWKSCKKCRYKRCEQLGMKLKRSVSEVAGGTSPYVGGEHLRLALSMTDKLTNDERMFIRSTINKRHECKIEHRARFLLRNPDNFRVRLNQTFHGQALTLKDFKLFEDFLVYGQLQTFSEGEVSSDGMTKKDRVRLLATNFPLANEFREAYRIEIERWKQYDPVKELEYVLRNLSLEDKNLYYDVQKEVTNDGKLQPKKVVYEAIYDHVGMDFQLEEQAQRHKRIVSRIISLSLNEPDPVLPMLIVSLIIYSPDSVDLDHPESAERLQLQFATLLHRYLKCKRTPRREAIFRECMMVPFYARELRAFREAAYKKKLGKNKS